MLVHKLQLVFGAVFLYHAITVYRLSKVDLSIPYAGIAPMALAASLHYFFWEAYSFVHTPEHVRIIAHLVWASGVLIMAFHIVALQNYFNPTSRWILWIRNTIMGVACVVLLSLLTDIFTGHPLTLSTSPMPVPPKAFPADIRDRIGAAFSTNALTAVLGILTILGEVAALGYFLIRLIRKKGDRWLVFGLLLTLAAIVNDLVASMRVDSEASSFMFVATFVEIIRLTLLIERANRERLLRSEHSMRLSQIGEMTATVAHELASPLATILGSSEIALQTRDPKQAEKLRETVLQQIHSAAQRMTVIVAGLRDYARGAEPSLEAVNIGHALEELVAMLRPLHQRDGIQLETRVSPNIPSIQGDAGRLQQVLLNLIQNARDATEGLPERRIQVFVETQGSEISISVRDNGSGIPQELQEKIFAPFFTTKPRGKGTGIGLSFVNSQVHALGGNIRVTSVPGDTVFDLRFPLA